MSGEYEFVRNLHEEKNEAMEARLERKLEKRADEIKGVVGSLIALMDKMSGVQLRAIQYFIGTLNELAKMFDLVLIMAWLMLLGGVIEAPDIWWKLMYGVALVGVTALIWNVTLLVEELGEVAENDEEDK